eukprot:TRINITY_DN43957_c0_g1_i2.p1 TRINITY_DN43957_c0_g1~~TRINITY_DN43957_c0_g1_i2.p1  ORF type:complete len:660 (+),score=208.67 TRINITY_DN43957_c0_g1_i2:77-2056(+)
MIRRPPKSTLSSSSAASDVYKRQGINAEYGGTRNRIMAYQSSSDNKWGLDSNDKYLGGQQRTYAMWCNQKLMEAGESFSFSIENLCEEFTTGVQVARMLQILATARRAEKATEAGQSTDGLGAQVHKEIGRIKDLPIQKMLPVFRRDNLNKCWSFMTKKENIKLGGVNVPSVMSGDQGTILAVIFRWVKSYDMADGYSELLEWVKSKTGTYIQVTGWSSSFNNGLTFLELYSNLCEDHFKETAGSMEDVLNMSTEERLTLAFDMIENGPLGVSQMLTLNDMASDHLDKDHKDQLMTYVSAIRAAHGRWYPEYLKSLEDKNDESANSLAEGDRLYKIGLQKFSNAREKSDQVITEIRSEITEELKNDENPDYDSYVATAQEKYVERMPEYDVSLENFTNAIDEYNKVTHVEVDEKVQNCNQKISEVNEHRDAQKNWLTEKLADDIQDDKAYKLYLEGCHELDDAVSEGTDFIRAVIEETVTKINESTRPEQREQLQKDAEKQAEDWIVAFDPAREKFYEAENLYPDSSVNEKFMCQEKRDEIDNTIAMFNEMMSIEIAEVLAKDFDDTLYEDELLKLYHQTTVAIDKLTKDGASDPGLEGLIVDPTKTKARLDDILSQVQGVWGDSDNLRQKVHDRIDAIFNKNGYDCKKGTDCCTDCAP